MVTELNVTVDKHARTVSSTQIAVTLVAISNPLEETSDEQPLSYLTIIRRRLSEAANIILIYKNYTRIAR